MHDLMSCAASSTRVEAIATFWHATTSASKAVTGGLDLAQPACDVSCTWCYIISHACAVSILNLSCVCCAHAEEERPMICHDLATVLLGLVSPPCNVTNHAWAPKLASY